MLTQTQPFRVFGKRHDLRIKSISNNYTQVFTIFELCEATFKLKPEKLMFAHLLLELNSQKREF